MFKKHAFSPNHKVVTASKHNFHPNGTEPTTAPHGTNPQGPLAVHGGPSADGSAQDGQTAGPVQSFADGGKCMADGDEILGGGVKGTLHDYGTAIEQTAHDLVNPNPVASGNKEEPFEGRGGADRKASINKQIEDAS
jgi:hypothetical protein